MSLYSSEQNPNMTETVVSLNMYSLHLCSLRIIPSELHDTEDHFPSFPPVHP